MTAQAAPSSLAVSLPDPQRYPNIDLIAVFIDTATTIVTVDLSLLKPQKKRRSINVMSRFRRPPQHRLPSGLPTANAWITRTRPRISRTTVSVTRTGVFNIVNWTACLLIISLAGTFSSAVAQVTEAIATDEQPQPLSEVQRLIRSSVESRETTQPEQIVEAAKLLLDVELFGDVKKMLSQLEALQLTDQQLIQLTDKVGSSFFSSVYLHPALQPEGRRVGGLALKGARNGLVSAPRLDRLIKSLSSNDISARSQAVRRLRMAGEPAIAGLLNGFTEESRINEFPGMRTALQTLAPEVPKPILAATFANDPQVRLEAIRALKNVRSKEALASLYLAVLEPKQNELVRSTANEILFNRQNMATADNNQVEAWFYQHTSDMLATKPTRLLHRRTEAIWVWDDKQQKVVAQDSNAATNQAQTAARYALGLFEANPQSIRNRQLYVLTQLELAKRQVGPNFPVDSENLIRKLKLTAFEANELLAKALKMELFPAATACCEIIKFAGDPSVLKHLSGNYPALTLAILSGERTVQFAALNAIISLDPKQAFAGASHAITLAVYLASGTGQPTALVGHHRLGVARTYAATVASSGLEGESAMTGKELFKIATNNSDIEIILISDTITSPSFANLIQQLKADWRTRKIPVALLFSDDFRGNRARIRLQKSGVTVIPFTAVPELITSTVDRMVDQVTPFRQDRSERTREAKVAIRWLAKISNNRKDYAFFELTSHEQAIQNLIYQPGFSNHVSDILASLATPDSQRQLVNYASEISLPVDQREHAIKAFKQAVKRTGVLLTKDEILLQYDRYNASEKLSAQTQQVLGSILDIIEGK